LLNRIISINRGKSENPTLPSIAQTRYDELDKRIAKTQAKKASLLLVLKHPELSLHNNPAYRTACPAELGVRQRVCKRDVSFGPRTQDGVRAWDTFAILTATAKKLEVSFYHYLYDRISGANQIPPMADLVTKRAKELIWDSLFRFLNSTPTY